MQLKITTVDWRNYVANTNQVQMKQVMYCMRNKVFPKCKITVQKYANELAEYWTTAPEAEAVLYGQQQAVLNSANA